MLRGPTVCRYQSGSPGAVMVPVGRGEVLCAPCIRMGLGSRNEAILTKGYSRVGVGIGEGFLGEVAHVYARPWTQLTLTPLPTVLAPLWSRSCSTLLLLCTTCCSTRKAPRWRCAWRTGCRRWCPCSTRTTPSSWPSPPTACSSWPMATRRAR